MIGTFLNIDGVILNLNTPVVMGILNITPDSFHKSSRVIEGSDIKELAGKLIFEGAGIIDIGGYSSRPGADHISEAEEIKRVSLALGVIRKSYPDAIISLDTFRSEVARIGIDDFGANIINDISGGEMDNNMFKVVAQRNVPYILMHMKGKPENMQDNPEYKDVVSEIFNWFSRKINELIEHGVKDIILDPGFGFGKTTIHNYTLLQKLRYFEMLGFPLLAGLSRKSMIWKELSLEPLESLNGTTVLNTIALLNGASILRVHDVKEAVQTVKLFCSTYQNNK